VWWTRKRIIGKKWRAEEGERHIGVAEPPKNLISIYTKHELN
jgi:hypothetical protein